jgi:glycosyltransferase involved in cell wall biosynthesis
MNGSNKTYNVEKREALYVTSFPHQRYRRPALAARALRLLNIKTRLLSGWETVSRYRPISTMVKASAYLPPPLNWLTKDIAYETGLLAAVRGLKPYLCINLNVVGALALRCAAPEGHLIIDIQDFTIQDDHTIPHYDLQTLKNSSPDLVILTSKAILELMERRYSNAVRRATYIPFGIDLKAFDNHYLKASPRHFREYLGLEDRPLLVYTGAAYLWGNREGQGIGIMLEAARIVRRDIPDIRLVIQGAAAPGTEVYRWIASRVKSLGLTNCCTLLPSTDPYDGLRMSMLKASDVLLLPIGDILGTYYSEQLKLYEYMAAARPIAMVATPARLNIVGKDEAYISGREPEEFAAQIIKALTDRDEALAKAQKARKLVEEKYDWQILAPLYGKAVAKAIGIPIEP